MSRTQKRESGTTNPVKKIISYKPNSGEFVVYDKASKSKETVEEISIIILDADRNSISGFSPEYDSGLLCNAVLNTKKEELVVGIIKNGKYKEIEKGFYQDIKEDIEGAKYTTNVFCLLVEGDDYSVADLQLVGMARSQFDEWYRENTEDAEASVVTLTPSKKVYNFVKKTGELEEVTKAQQKKWRTTWLRTLTPSLEELTEDEDSLAITSDEGLQAYFKGSSAPAVEKNEDVSDSNDDDDDDDVPF